MRNALVAAAAGLAAGVLIFGLTGCGSATKTESMTSESSATSQAASTLPPIPTRPDGTKETLHDYIVQNGIAETPFKARTPGTPDIELPFPPGWSELAKEDVPDWAYGGIIYDKPSDPALPPTIMAIASKLTGDATVADILKYTPGMLENLPDFKPVGEPVLSKSSGFDAVTCRGTYTNDGKDMVVGEKTVVVPGKDKDFFVLQLQATALASERQPVLDAVAYLADNSKITAP